MLNGLAGKTAVLTGAGSGFGLECARIAAQAGMRLALVDVQADALAQAAAMARALGSPQVMACKTDVGDAQAMDMLAQQVHSHFGAPHFVFNNAGVGGAGGLLWEQSTQDWQWVLNVNLWGVIHGVRVFTPMMLQAAAQDPNWQGHIVNTASMAGLLNAPNMGVYNVSKHAVVSLTETLYQDLRLVTDQLHCSVLCPYFVPTGIATSERNRPDVVDERTLTASQKIARAMSQKAVSAGKLTAQDIASKVFAAMADNQFYILSHPHALGNVQARMEDIVQMQNPRDAFAQRPEVGEQLRAALRATSAAPV